MAFSQFEKKLPFYCAFCPNAEFNRLSDLIEHKKTESHIQRTKQMEVKHANNK